MGEEPSKGKNRGSAFFSTALPLPLLARRFGLALLFDGFEVVFEVEVGLGIAVEVGSGFEVEFGFKFEVEFEVEFGFDVKVPPI
jgi:hypothetical protein